MGFLGIVIVSISMSVAFIARDGPTGDFMLSTFQAGQSFYSEGAYDQAIDKYRSVGDVTSVLLDDRDIVVVVGEVEATVKDAATYQVGNSYFKLFEEESLAAQNLRDAKKKARRLAQAEEYLEQAVSSFSRVEEQSNSEELRVLAQGRIMTCWYSARHFENVIREGREFVEGYPQHPYVVEALYNIGWSYYELKDYDNSILAFTELTQRFQSGFQVSRALFQIGECYYDQERFAEAIPHYQALVDQADIGELTEQDVQRMQFEKVAGLVDETEYELTAKAQIRIGDSHSQLRDFDKAEDAYRTVTTVFSQERRLVEKAYQSLADMYFSSHLLARCVDAYREAIDNAASKTFQARMQFQLAQRYTEASKEWGEDLFADAIREYNVYLKAYAEVASSAGYSLANTWYEIGQVHYARAERLAAQGAVAPSRNAYREALQAYSTQLEQYPDPAFDMATRFNAALSQQMIGGDAQNEAIDGFRQIIVEDPDGPYATSSQFQLARIQLGLGQHDQSAATYAEIIAATADSSHLDVAHFELGLVLATAKDLPRATRHLLQVRKGSPQYSLSRLEAARGFVSLTDYDQALVVLQQGMEVAQNDGERAQYWYLTGKAYVGKQDYTLAVDAFSKTIGVSADPLLREIARYDRGTSYTRLERYVEAVDDLKILSDSDNERIRGAVQRMLGMAYLRLNDSQEALKSYLELAAASTDLSERADYLVLILELYMEQEQYEEAVAVGRQILALGLVDDKKDREYSIQEQVHFLIAESQHSAENYEAAVAAYREGLRRYPDSFYSPDMSYALGTLYFQMDRLDEAAATLEDFVSRFGDSPNALYGFYYLGYAHFSLREFDKSRDVFADLAQKFPDSEVAAESMMRVAESAFNLSEFATVIDVYQEVLVAYPDAPIRDEATYNMAWAYYEAKDEEAFVQGLRRLLDTFPESEFAPDARFTLGDHFFNKEMYQQALTEYQIVMRDHGDSKIALEVPEVLKNVQEIIAYGEYEKAIAIFSEGLSLEKTDNKAAAVEKFREVVPLFVDLMEKYPGTEVQVGALSNLGICYEFLNQWTDAVQTYDKVIELFENQQASQEAYQFAKGHRDWIVTSRL
jgi:tetratricopeptide (TPR) repeat protein